MKKYIFITALILQCLISYSQAPKQVINANGLLVCMTLKGQTSAFVTIEQLEDMGYYRCDEVGTNMWLHMCREDDRHNQVCNLELFAQPGQTSKVDRVYYSASSRFYNGQAWRDGLSSLGFRKTSDDSKTDLFNVFNETWEGNYEGFYVKVIIKENLQRGEIELSRYQD